jgi:hypothetical protein
MPFSYQNVIFSRAERLVSVLFIPIPLRPRIMPKILLISVFVQGMNNTYFREL